MVDAAPREMDSKDFHERSSALSDAVTVRPPRGPSACPLSVIAPAAPVSAAIHWTDRPTSTLATKSSAALGSLNSDSIRPPIVALPSGALTVTSSSPNPRPSKDSPPPSRSICDSRPPHSIRTGSVTVSEPEAPDSTGWSTTVIPRASSDRSRCRSTKDTSRSRTVMRWIGIDGVSGESDAAGVLSVAGRFNVPSAACTTETRGRVTSRALDCQPGDDRRPRQVEPHLVGLEKRVLACQCGQMEAVNAGGEKQQVIVDSLDPGPRFQNVTPTA